MAYTTKPRIVVEESPLGHFLSGLPEQILSFMQLQNQLKIQQEERQKDRDWQLSKMYIQDQMNTKNTLQAGLFDAINDANESGQTLNISLANILSRSPEHSTAKSGEMNQDYQGYLENYINFLGESYGQVSANVQLFNQGKKHALSLDTNFDGMIDTDEINVFNEKNKMQGLEDITEPFLEGARNELLRPEVRKAQTKHRKRQAAIDVLELFEKTNPNNEHVIEARIGVSAGASTEKIQSTLMKIPGADDGTGTDSDLIKTKDTTFRNMYERLQVLHTEARGGLNQKFLKPLSAKGIEEYKAGSLDDLEFLKSEKMRFAENFAIWFSGKDKQGKKVPMLYSQVGGREYTGVPKTIRNVFNKAFKEHGWEKVDLAVNEAMNTPEFQEMINNPKLLGEQLNFRGKGKEEDNATDFFKTSYDIYTDLVDLEGEAEGYDPKSLSSEFIKKLSDATPADTTTVPTEPVTVPTDTTDKTRVDEVMAPADSTRVAIEQNALIDRRALIKDNELNNLTNEHMQVLNNPNISPELLPIILDSLTNIDQERAINELVNTINNSPAIKNDFALTGQTIPIDSIIQAFKDSKHTNVERFLLDTFPEIEADLIR